MESTLKTTKTAPLREPTREDYRFEFGYGKRYGIVYVHVWSREPIGAPDAMLMVTPYNLHAVHDGRLDLDATPETRPHINSKVTLWAMEALFAWLATQAKFPAEIYACDTEGLKRYHYKQGEVAWEEATPPYAKNSLLLK